MPDLLFYSVSVQFSSVSRSVLSDSLQLHGLQHARLPCPSPTPEACSNLCPWNRWCQPTISASVIAFSFCLQSFSASGYFPVSQFFASDDQSIGASASVLPINLQDCVPLGLTDLNSLLSKGLSRVFSNTTVQKHQFYGNSAFFMDQLSHPYMTTGKTISLTRRTFVGKIMSLLFNMLSRLIIAFLPRSKHLLISCLQSCLHLQWFWSPGKKSLSLFPLFPHLFAMKCLASTVSGLLPIM